MSFKPGVTVIGLRVWGAGVRTKARGESPTPPLANLRGPLTGISFTFFRQQHPKFPVMHRFHPFSTQLV